MPTTLSMTSTPIVSDEGQAGVGWWWRYPVYDVDRVTDTNTNMTNVPIAPTLITIITIVVGGTRRCFRGVSSNPWYPRVP